MTNTHLAVKINNNTKGEIRRIHRMYAPWPQDTNVLQLIQDVCMRSERKNVLMVSCRRVQYFMRVGMRN